jgi:hypothetical protein
MRRKAYLERSLIRAKSDLVKAKLGTGWNEGPGWDNGLVNYLLGQVVTLMIVLDAELDWTTAYNVTIEQVDRSVADIRKKVPVDGQEAFCSTCSNIIVFSKHTGFWSHKYEGVDPPGYMDAENKWQICGGPLKPREDLRQGALLRADEYSPKKEAPQ